MDIELLSSGVQIGSDRRQLKSLEHSIRDLQMIQETAGPTRSVIFKLLMGQAGGCDTAFDNNSNVVSYNDVNDFATICDAFAPFDGIRNSATCCCALCRDGSSNSQKLGLSRYDFGQWLVESLQVKFGDIIEVDNPNNRKSIEVFELVPLDDDGTGASTCREGESEARSPSIFLGLDYQLQLENYDEFLSIFLGSYNRLSLEACFPQRIRNNAVIGDLGTEGGGDAPRPSRPSGGGGTRGPDSCTTRASCLMLEMAVECSARVCPQGDSLDVLFGDSSSRRLNKASSSQGTGGSPTFNELIVSPHDRNQRQLQISGIDRDECFCLATTEGTKEPTFKPVVIDDFINEFNNDLEQAGYGKIGSIDAADDFVERDNLEEDDGPSVTFWIIVAVCFASLLAVVFFLLVRRRRRSSGNIRPLEDHTSEDKVPQKQEEPTEVS